MSTPLQLTLYRRTGCHLCEAMQGQLLALQKDYAFSLQTVDIDDDPALEAAYGEQIPVLMHGETEICHYFLELSKLQQYFSQA
ncbi:glutaredoxin family protein [Thiohalophilus sp.]|uniref:glutaredoxin family protein n=1 Tax=Thiohalophilus sp. TaxID=3028392 RepID=UPI002ACDD17D|nr:glutaredoxin family protein [Thiohalophilus sp.]MDZ7805078.1 glutaredoxin family protein [Thiohalophilus sp.]